VSSLGPSLSRFVFQGGVGEASTVAPSRNKSLQPRSRSGGARSGVGGRSVRVVPSTSCTGVWPLPALLQAAAEAMRYIGHCTVAGRLVMECRMELLRISVVFQWRQHLQDQVLKGCVPGRWFFLICLIPSPGAGGYCGSFRSLWAMIMLLISVDHLCGGGFRCRTVRWDDTVDPMDLLAISFFS
jgi:hypothetical protein